MTSTGWRQRTTSSTWVRAADRKAAAFSRPGHRTRSRGPRAAQPGRGWLTTWPGSAADAVQVAPGPAAEDDVLSGQDLPAIRPWSQPSGPAQGAAAMGAESG